MWSIQKMSPCKKNLKKLYFNLRIKSKGMVRNKRKEKNKIKKRIRRRRSKKIRKAQLRMASGKKYMEQK